MVRPKRMCFDVYKARGGTVGFISSVSSLQVKVDR